MSNAFAEAKDIGRALRGIHIDDRTWRVSCPFADQHPRKKGYGLPSMLIRAGADRIEATCSQGCDSGKLITWLARRGHIEGGGPVRHVADEEAVAIWKTTRPILGTHGAAFLKAEGLDPRLIPATIRFRQPGRVRLPMIAAAVQAPDNRPIALHLVLLDRDIPRLVDRPIPRRLTVGSLGRGAIRISPPSADIELVDDLLEALRAAQLGRALWCSLGAWRRDRIELPVAGARAA